jgi:hypothetical protein
MTGLISSRISLYLRRMDPPQKFTPHVEDCVNRLESLGDLSNDRLAVALVRLQAILERVCLHLVAMHNISEGTFTPF